ncbi:MAG: ABC transporter substrate-binding protein [Castellaniella sp.]|uniref:ABC transporter substrate-binding protein n=1 Tax=Castellaniella sp. TaxID=1955812 RepID=UPI0011F8819F|nr:ABC transporter substrate-binding protein [Castellaniella sp.]TAN26664.1 MAG: ABC transporter substrate-binding protein [Castellaniella sp.]
MKFSKTMGAVALALAAAVAVSPAQAKDLKIGLVLSVSGPFAAYGKQISHGVDLYIAEHGDTVAGRKIQVIVKDDTGIAPAVAKRQAQELLVKDKVDILAGFDLTPNAFSVAPLATEAKVPMVVMNAATSSVTEKSPNVARVSMTLPQSAWAMAEWAYKNGVRSAYTLVADYGPGHDAEKQFQKTFTALGGKVVGEVRTPVITADYSPFLQRMKDAKPDAAFFFVPPGSSMVALLKQFREMGLEKAGIKELGTGDMTDEDSLAAMGDTALGMITAFHYSENHNSPENKKFVAAYKKAYPNDRPNFMSVGGYDGMHLIYAALEKTKGDASAEAFMKAVKGMKWESPRGPVEIDPQTRDIIQNEYIRKLEKVDGVAQNVEFYTFKDVKDPGKQ